MLEKQQKKRKRKKVHAVFLSSRIYTDFVWRKNNNTYQVIYLLSLYLRLQITSQQVLLNFKPKNNIILWHLY